MTIPQESQVQVGAVNNYLLMEALMIEGRHISEEFLDRIWQCVEDGEILLGLVRDGKDWLVISFPRKEFLEFFHSSVQSAPELVFEGYYVLSEERVLSFLLTSREIIVHFADGRKLGDKYDDLV